MQFTSGITPVNKTLICTTGHNVLLTQNSNLFIRPRLAAHEYLRNRAKIMEPIRACAEHPHAHLHAHAGARPRYARWITSHPGRPGRQQETAMEEEEEKEEEKKKEKEEEEEEAAFAASHSARGPRPRPAPPHPASPPRVPRGRPCGSGARGSRAAQPVPQQRRSVWERSPGCWHGEVSRHPCCMRGAERQ